MITVEQFALLVHLWEQDGVTRQELGERVAKHKTSINSLLNNPANRPGNQDLATCRKALLT